MEITKEKKEILLYIIVFLVANFSYLILYMTVFNLYAHLVLDKIEGSCRMCGMSEVLIIIFLSWIIKVVIPIKASLWVIQKSNNAKLLKIYNNFKIPTIILLFFICFDFLITTYVPRCDAFGAYILTSGIFPTFLIIYIIAITNTMNPKFFRND